MPYKVQFVGLVCFYREHGTRRALLPDGRDPGPGMDAHFASILVDPRDVEAAAGWTNENETARGIYTLPACSISIAGTDNLGTLNAAAHDGVLPQLRQIDPAFEIDPERAQTVAQLSIRQGTLTVHPVPGGTALMSQLVVPYEEPITVTVSPRDGSSALTLRLRPDTEILLGNMAEGGVYAADHEADGHFCLYEKLSVRPVSLSEPASVAAAPPLQSNHWFFQNARPINLSVSCTNTGCC